MSGIWGTIAARIVMSLNDKKSIAEPVVRRMTMDTTQVILYNLALSYEDPFLKTTKKKIDLRLQASIRTGIKSKIAPDVPVPASILIPWELIHYSGLVYNSTRNSKTAAVTIGSTEYFLKEGEELEHFRVLEISPDSIKVTFMNSNQIKYIKKK